MFKNFPLKVLLFILFFIATKASAQKVEKVWFEQVGRQIFIYYDFTGTQTRQSYNIEIFCSTDGGNTFGSALKAVSGDIGSNQAGGLGKRVAWDVPKEREELTGDIIFEVRARSISGEFGTINVNAPNAQIWLDNEPVAKEKYTFKLKADKYSLKATRDNYYDEERFVILKAGDYLEYNFDLKPKIDKNESLNTKSNYAIISAGYGMSYGSNWGIRAGFLSGSKVRMGINGSIGIFKEQIQYEIGLRIQVYKEWAIIAQYGTRGYIYNTTTGEFLYLRTGVSMLLGYDWFFSNHVGITWGIGGFYDTNYKHEIEFVSEAGIVFRF